jgi:hypothetical protein
MLIKPLPERRDVGLSFWIILGKTYQHTDPSHLVEGLRSGIERQRDRHAAEKCYKVAPPHSMTSSASISRRTAQHCAPLHLTSDAVDRKHLNRQLAAASPSCSPPECVSSTVVPRSRCRCTSSNTAPPRLCCSSHRLPFFV